MNNIGITDLKEACILLFTHCIHAGYDCVCSHLVNITSLIQTTKGARERLTQHYIQRRWLDSTQNPSENELVKQALLRIKIDPSQYDTFLTMLRDTEGLDLIVKALKYGRGEIYHSAIHRQKMCEQV